MDGRGIEPLKALENFRGLVRDLPKTAVLHR
jgi:hypothetical protein